MRYVTLHSQTENQRQNHEIYIRYSETKKLIYLQKKETIKIAIVGNILVLRLI